MSSYPQRSAFRPPIIGGTASGPAALSRHSAIYQPRLGLGEVGAAHGSVAAAFAAGDYAFAARFGAAEAELQACAYVLIGNPERGLSLLDALGEESERPRPYRALAHWYRGSDARARALLAADPSDPPQRATTRAFRRLLERPEIDVLVATARPSLLSALRRVPGFRVRSVGLPGQDCDLALDERLRLGHSAEGAAALVAADFFLLFDLGVPIPSDLRDRPIPKFAYVPDVEMHLANDVKLLNDMDIVVTASSQVAAEIRALCDCRTVVLPIFGAPSAIHDSGPARTEPAGERPIDILFTGSIATPLYIEKPGRFLRLSQLADRYDIRLLDRTYPPAEFKRLLASAKFTAVSIRFNGGISTRAIEALRHGTFALCLNPTDLDLYLTPFEEGVFPLDDGDDWLDRVEGCLSDYATESRRFAARRATFQQKLATLFPHSPNLEQRWLKLLAFLALDVAAPKPGPAPANTALTWFNARLYDDKAAAGRPLLAAPAAADRRIKQAVTAATVMLGRDDLAGLRRLAAELEPPRAEPPESLMPALLSALLFARADDPDAAERLLARLWAGRHGIRGQPWDGLLYFDFWSSNWLRAAAVSEALYGDAVILAALRARGHAPQRRSAEPTALLLSGVGCWLAERRAAAGKWGEAAALAAEALKLAPENFAARRRLALARLSDPASLPDKSLQQAALDDFAAALALWPWYLPDILPLLHADPELDRAFLDGETHAVYLRFAQRLRTDRRGVADFRLARAARPYLRFKLGLGPEPDDSLESFTEQLEARGLRLCEPSFFAENIALPLFWDAAEERARQDPAAAARMFSQARAAWPVTAGLLEHEAGP